jgi:hypothetical protein
MRLLIVGDSFTYGDELTDLTKSWPNILVDKLGCELINLSRSGSGNVSMIRHCVEQVDNYDIAIIAWSHWARIEFADELGIYDTWPGHHGLVFTENAEFRRQLLQYITDHHNDRYLYNQHLMNIILVQNYLKSAGKKYIMLDAFGKRPASAPNINQTLEKQIDSAFYIEWPNKNMTDWTWGTPKGPRGHFLEDGHKIVADKVYEHIRHLSWVS